jgi:hypothetical protein
MPSLEMATSAGLSPVASSWRTFPLAVSSSDTEPAVWLATSKREPSKLKASAIGERCGSSFAAGEEEGATSAPLSLVQSEGIAATTMIVLRTPSATAVLE